MPSQVYSLSSADSKPLRRFPKRRSSSRQLSW